MKRDFLTDADRLELRAKHRKEKDRSSADRIKAVLLADKGWSYRQIAEALFLDEDTISKHVDEYKTDGKLKKADCGGSASKLSATQTAELVTHLEQVTYTTAAQVCDHVQI